ncbi:MAG: hypothetical protein LQ340_002109 [Diploschistes diacapsis]|nr:MAG: hypothetical protein LQ340_002109 [Diploschistes diacapsis]
MAPDYGPDDFVLTISDDEMIPLFEEEGDGASIEWTDNSLKRKRAAATVTGEAPEGAQKKKRQRKGRNGKIDGNGAAPSSREEGRDAQVQGHNDGAMNSDFEFQIGDIDDNDLKGFDSWGIAKPVNGTEKTGNKKGVDIDDLIARRRKRKPHPAEDTEESNMWDGLSASEEGFERETGNEDSKEEDKDVEAKESTETESQVEEEDELLEPDAFGMGVIGEDEESGIAHKAVDPDELDDTSSSEDQPMASVVPHPFDKASDVDENEEQDEEEKARQEAFFAPESQDDKAKLEDQQGSGSFHTMSLSRPILRGLAAVGFTKPTPIQAKTVPVALLGKDIVGGAVTGSGKTAAFLIPILERLLYRPKKVPTSRVAILMPTRELAVQCYNVAKKLASFTDITFCQLVGGFSLREQESILKKRPDVIIATPGRFIDHMRNSASFTVDTLEILVLDEADRMLEDGFADELNEILTTIPKSRQTMLFSATMTSSVDKLIRVGLNRPVRLLVDPKRQTVGTLTQEFLRLRPGREQKRLAYLLHLCTEVFTDRCIIFFRQKKEAHRMRIIFGLFGFKAAELHGNMSQEQRIASVEAFRAGTATHLLATDVASRGLDIKGVETVLNYEAPQSLEIYLHRVGRTARAGRVGRACTIAAEPDRKVVKAAVKTGRAQGAKIVSRIVDSALADMWHSKLKAIDSEVEEILKEEKEEKALSQADMQVKKGENIMEHEDEIMSRPKRTWFESEKEKMKARKAGREELNGPSANKKKKVGKLSAKDKKRLDDGRERREGRMWKKGKGEREMPGSKAGSRGPAPGKERKKGKPNAKPNGKVNSKTKTKGR